MVRNLLGIFTLAAIAAPVLAHHSESADYDINKKVNITGTITKVEWQNPHIRFCLDVKDDAGKVTAWGISAAPPGALKLRGFTMEDLAIGAVIRVTGARARDGSNRASSHGMTLADGRSVMLGPAEFDYPNGNPSPSGTPIYCR